MSADERIQLRVEPELKEWAREYAKRQGTTVSSVLKRYLEELKASDDAKQEIKVHEF